MKMRVSIGALGCALFVAVPAFAQEPAETPAADVPAATAGPAAADETPVAGEPVAPAPATETEMTAGTEVAPPTEPVVEKEEQHGFELGVRIAYGIPLGGATKAQNSLDEDVDLSDVVAGLLPIQLDLGYRINNHLFVGGYGSYAFGFKPDLCDDSPVECDSPSQVRVGGEVLFNVLPVTHAMSPWIGAGIGYEWLNGPVSDGQLHGMEFFNVQAGVDFRLADHMRLGPYAQFSLGQYSKASATVLGEDVSNDLDDKATHEWLNFGIKATFGAFGGD
jgi:hypothetical protein